MTSNEHASFPHHEIAIVGAGPIGIELGAALKRIGADYIHFDAKQIGYTISWWPRNTQFFSTSERIAIAGFPIQTLKQDHITGEEYLVYLRGIIEQLDLQINTYEPVLDIQPQTDGFLIKTQPQGGEGCYHSRYVIVATGDMHAPNRLNIPGEDLPHVSHYFTDPHTYFRKRLLVVGGRNSAVESAIRCWRAGSQVSISYRRPDFDPEVVKAHLLPDMKTQIERENIEFFPETVPLCIEEDHVVLAPVREGKPVESQAFRHPTDFVLLNTGFVADMSLFEKAGVQLQGESQTPFHDSETMETNIPGLYVAGTAAAGTQKRYKLFIENCHIHVGKITQAITGIWPEKLGTVPARSYELPFRDIQTN